MVKSKTYKQSVTLNKRKRGILRKAIELATICGQHVYIAIADPKSKTLAEYKSDAKFDLKTYENFELYDNEDYEALSNKFITKKQLDQIQNRHRDGVMEPGEMLKMSETGSTTDDSVDNILSKLVPNFGKKALSQKIKKNIKMEKLPKI